MTSLDQFTLTTIPLEQYFNETRLGQGTGFIWKVQRQYYLVTTGTCSRWATSSREAI